MVIKDTLQEGDDGTELNLVSDASVHVDDRKVADTWHLISGPQNKRRVVRPLEHQTHAHSYQHELETCYHGLKDATGVLQNQHTITQQIDNEAGIDKLNEEIYAPSSTMETDMDVFLDKETHHHIRKVWVQGHADVKKKKDPTKITPMERENIECDKEVDECVQAGTPPAPFTPLPGY
ncbi:hypothetical protein ACHAXR_004902 [Thalassiosira sp. AJA248-18]